MHLLFQILNKVSGLFINKKNNFHQSQAESAEFQASLCALISSKTLENAPSISTFQLHS